LKLYAVEGNRYAFVGCIVTRARQLEHGAEAHVPATIEDNVVSIALQELTSGRVRAEESSRVDRTPRT